MIVGLALSLTQDSFIKNAVSFDYQFFFNLLLPPIILAAGYELHQVRKNCICIRLGLTWAGKLLSKCRHDLDLRLRWHLHLRPRARNYPLAMHADTV